MPKAFGGTYTADKDPALAGFSQSTLGAAGKIRDAKDPMFLLAVQGQAIQNLLQMLKDTTGIDLTWVSGALTSLVEGLNTLLGNAFNGLMQFDLAAALAGLVDGIENALDIDLSWISETLTSVWNFLNYIFGDIVDGLTHPTDALNAFFNSVEQLLGINIPDLPPMSEIVEAITGALNGTADTLKDFFEGFVHGGGTLIQQLVKAITGGFGGLTELGTFFGGFVHGAGDLLAQIVKALTGAIGGGLDTLEEWVTHLPTIGQIVEQFTGSLNGTLSDIGQFLTHIPTIEEIVGSLTGNFLAGLDGLAAWASDIPFISEIVRIFTGTAGTLADLEAWVENLPLIGDIVQVLTGQEGPLQALEHWASQLLTAASGIDASKIFGQISSALFGLIPASHIGQHTPNLLVNGSFDTAETLSGGGVWSWDSSKDHTANNGGSAKLAPHGVQRDLMSDLVAVADEQELSVSGYLSWADVTFAAGSQPFHMALTCYSDEYGRNVVAAPDLAVETSNASSGGWRKLSGVYSVPAGVNSVRLRLTVTAAANGGSVWWDDLSMTKTNNIPQALVHGLTSALDGARQFVQDLIDGILHALTGIPIIGGVIEDVLQHLGILKDTANSAVSQAAGAAEDLNVLSNNLINSPGEVIGDIPEEIVPGIGLVIDNVVNGIGGLFGSQFTHFDLEHALTSQSAALVGANNAIQKLLALQSSGVTVIDDFNRQAGAIGGNWSTMPAGSSVYYPKGGGGGIVCDGNNMAWEVVGNTPQTQLMRYATKSSTNFQNVGVVLSSQGQDPFLGQTSCIQLLARVSDDGLNYCRVQVSSYAGNNDSLQIFYCINGVETRLYVGRLSPIPGTGTSINYLCGLLGSNARTHTVMVNNQISVQITEQSAVSLVGPNYLGWGAGMTAGSNWFHWFTPLQAAPAKYNLWTARDQ